jgi:hypothetical protein
VNPERDAPLSEPTEELIDLLRAVCAAPMPTDALAGESGKARPQTRPGSTTHVEPTRYRSIPAIDLRPWRAGKFGVVELKLEVAQGWRLDQLERLLGPLRTVPGLHGPSHEAQGIFDDPGLPAWAAVYIELSSDGSNRIDAIRIRTEPRR